MNTAILKKTLLKRAGLPLSLLLLISACSSESVNPNVTELNSNAPITVEVKTRADLSFQPLNPARGDASPQAGVLWGDITQDEASGVLLKFADGFSSPPHIHNITYKAVVISGQLHNDDPDAAIMWMGPGSFWTQPAGETHITAAIPGEGATAFLEIQEGPYLVRPSDAAYDNGERPINVDPANIVWLGVRDTSWIDTDQEHEHISLAEIAFLWGQPGADQTSGSFIKLPQGFDGVLKGSAGRLRAVMIEGALSHEVSEKTDVTDLKPGDYFSSSGGAAHHLSCRTQVCIIYIRSEGRYQVTERG